MVDKVKAFLSNFKSYEITYTGVAFSINDIYGSNNWRVRKGVVDKYKNIFIWLIKEQKLPKIDKYIITLFYNSRHDADNTAGVLKVMGDSLKTQWVENDDPRFCKGVASYYDPSLPHNTFKFVITPC